MLLDENLVEFHKIQIGYETEINLVEDLKQIPVRRKDNFLYQHIVFRMRVSGDLIPNNATETWFDDIVNHIVEKQIRPPTEADYRFLEAKIKKANGKVLAEYQRMIDAGVENGKPEYEDLDP